MIDLLIIPASAICNRWRGGGIYRFEWEKRLDELENWTTWHELTPFPLTEYAKLKTRSKWLARKLISGVILAVICALFAKNVWVFPIILAGWYLRNIIGTGMLFNAIHGWTASKWKGALYGAARGLLTLATTIPLAWVAGNMYLSLWGLLGALQGVIFYVAGKIAEKTKFESVTVAELIDGALYGLILAAIL